MNNKEKEQQPRPTETKIRTTDGEVKGGSNLPTFKGPPPPPKPEKK